MAEPWLCSHPTRRTRTIGSWIMWGLTSLIALAWVDVLRRGFETVKTGEAAAFALTALVALAAIWIGGGRSEWTLAPNRMRVRFRVHSWMLRDAAFGDGSDDRDRTRPRQRQRRSLHTGGYGWRQTTRARASDPLSVPVAGAGGVACGPHAVHISPARLTVGRRSARVERRRRRVHAASRQPRGIGAPQSRADATSPGPLRRRQSNH